MERFSVTLFFLLLLKTISVEAQSNARIYNFETLRPDTDITIHQVDPVDFPKVKLVASVSRGGLLLSDLTSENFRVRENDAEQTPIKVFVQGKPVSAVLLLDISASMGESVGEVKNAAITFLQTLDEKDRLEILTFHEEVETVYPMGNDFAKAAQAVATIRARGKSALYDGVYRSIDTLRRASGQRAVVIISNGVDDDGKGRQLSNRNFDEILMLGITEEIPLFTVGVGFDINAGILQTLAGTTGADYVTAFTRAELESLYARTVRQSPSQFCVEYTSLKPTEKGERKVQLDLVTFPGELNHAMVPRQVCSYKVPVADKWPKGLPVYQKADEINIGKRNEENAFSFQAPEGIDNFLDSYRKKIRDSEWSIRSETNTENRSLLKAYKGRSEMSVLVEEEEGKSRVSVEYSLPVSQPVWVKQDDANQIIAADGRDVIVTGDGGVIIVSGGCGKLTLTGSRNQVQCDTVKEVEVTGSRNVIILGSLGNGTIGGEGNDLAWGSGLERLKPVVKSTGATNLVRRLE
ncbi:MAG: VWA domain-containing protein [Verrucomicrobiales bacterium]|nr:VWA domain-containing protein [Verrucomicrobiales bacterium]